MARQKESWHRALGRWLGGGLIELPDNVEVTRSGRLRVEIDEETRTAARARARRHYGLKEIQGNDSASSPESDSAKEGIAT